MDFDAGERYRVVRELGRGGMGVVFLGHDLERDIAVALKVQSSPHVHDMLWLKREFRVVGSMRHPNLVEFFDLVAEQDRCFFSMEYVDGVSALNWVGSAPSDPVNFERVEKVLFEVAQALHYLHVRGVIHRDVKPGNVLVNRNGVAKLLDFGVALGTRSMQATDRHLIGTIEGIGQLTGTVPYLAPEYIARFSLGSSIDLYGLGALAFRMCTGRVPFDGALIDVQRAQLRAGVAPRVSSFNPKIPGHLDDLIADLLNFDDEARPTADDVVMRLGAKYPLHVKSSTRHFTPRFIGRDAELAQLVTIMQGDAAVPPHPPATRPRTSTMVLVVGTAGVGKATLLREGVAECRSTVMSWRGRCKDNEHVPYRAFDAIIDDIACGIAEVGLPVGYHASAALQQVFPNLQPALGPLRSSYPTVDPRVAKDVAHRDFAILLDVLLDKGRGSLVIEELQWADPESIELIRVILADQQRNVVVIASVTTVHGGAIPAHIVELVHSVGGTMLELAPLTKLDRRAMVSDLMPFASDSAKQRVADMAAGSPLLTELYADESMLQTDLPTDVIMAPATLRDLTDDEIDIQDATLMRIARLGEHARTVALYLAGAAGALHFGQLAELTELAPLALHGAISALLDARLIRTAGAAANRGGYEFVHPSVSVSVYRSMREVQKRILHNRIATWHIAKNDPATFAHMIASQLCAAGPSLAGAQWCLQAAEIGLRQLAFANARFWFERARSQAARCDASVAERIKIENEATLGIARSAQLAGNQGAAALAFRTLADNLPNERATWLRHAAEADIKGGNIEQGMAFARELLRRHGPVAHGSSLKSAFTSTALAVAGLAQRRGAAPHDAVASLTFRMVTKLLATTRPLEAFDYTMRMLRVAWRSDDAANINLAHALSAAYLIALTNGTLGRRFANIAIKRARKHNDEYAEAVGQTALGILYACRGEWTKMRTAFAAGEHLCEDLGMAKSWEASFLRCYRGIGEMQAGEHAFAVLLLVRTVKDSDDFVSRILARAFRGRALVAAGQLAAAHVLASELPFDDAALGMAQVQCDIFRCELAIKQGDWAAALLAADVFERHARLATVWNLPALRSDCDIIRAEAYAGLAALPGPQQSTFALRSVKHAAAVLVLGPFTAYVPIVWRIFGDVAHSAKRPVLTRLLYRVAKVAADRRGGATVQADVAARLRTK